MLRIILDRQSRTLLPKPNMEPISQLDVAFEKKVSRYVVGIDLGTTNCAVAYVDTLNAPNRVEIFSISQMVDFSTSQPQQTLPSFHYELTHNEIGEMDALQSFRSAEHTSVVGVLARERGIQMPGRGIASAKSWLCHPLVDRTAKLLPWNGDEEVERLSPVDVSRRYLEQIRRMWDRDHPNERLADQDTIVTLPASFDEVARQLTVQAATEAGLPHVILIEEPQAAFYAWLQRHETDWVQTIQPGHTVLVCDIGGGTTDFTLIRVIASQGSAADPIDNPMGDASQQSSQTLKSTYGLHRVAVGQHLMLGGDNLDLALAKYLEQRLLAETPGQDQLRPRQWETLKAQCRVAKETLLGTNPPDTYSISLPGTGSKRIESTRTLTIDRASVHELLIEGFFGRVALSDRPLQQEVGFQEFGLPYASEPNVHKHLAEFLWEHRWAGREDGHRTTMSDPIAARPDWILFNGGVLESSQIQIALLQQIADWFRTDEAPDWAPGLLRGNRLDLAVAQGAAYFGRVRRGQGVRIDARLARAYYLLVHPSPPEAMCIMPANAMPGDRFDLEDHPFELTLGQPVQFLLMYSSTHLVHTIGQIVPVDPHAMISLPPIRTVLELPDRKRQATLPVILESELSEIGTLQMQMIERISALRWKLEFDVRGTSQSEALVDDRSGVQTGVSNSQSVQHALHVMAGIFGPDATIPPKECFQRLADAIGQSRRDWKPSLLRELWRYLIEHPDGRKPSAEHEARWLNLLGWSLRPGFGMVADDWRVHTTWRTVHNKLLHRSSTGVSETVILWRRIAGGFTAGQQNALYLDAWSRIRPMLAGGGTSSATLNTNVAIELLRLVGSLEWLRSEDRAMMGKLLLQTLNKKKWEPLHPAILWTLGRLGARVPVYATLQQVLGVSHVQAWIESLLEWDPASSARMGSHYTLCLMQLSRRTNDRYRDILPELRHRVEAKMEQLQAPEAHLQLVHEGGKLDAESESTIIGDSLPLGFSIRRS